MAILRESITLDGVTDVSAFGRTYGWEDQFRSNAKIDAFLGNGDGYALTVALTGSFWRMDHLRFAADAPYAVTLTDSADGDRRIKLVEPGQNGPATLTMQGTRVDFFRGGDFPETLTLGTQRTSAVELFDADHTVTLGSGGVSSVRLSDGDDRLFAPAGTEADSVNVSGGANRIEVDGGRMNALIAYDGNDTLSVTDGGRVTSAFLGNGNHTVTVRGTDSFIGSLDLEDGNDTVTIANGGRITFVNLGEGRNSITTGDRFIQYINAFDGQTTVRVGEGGVGTVKVGLAFSHHRVFRGRLGDEAREHRRRLFAIEFGVVVLVEQEQPHHRRRNMRQAPDLARVNGTVDVQHFLSRHADGVRNGQPLIRTVPRMAAAEVIGHPPPDQVKLDPAANAVAVWIRFRFLKGQHLGLQKLQL